MLLTIANILGGLGIFLLAVTMMTDGLKLAAGDGLKDALVRSTRTPLRGLTFGAVVTSLVRSSSAVTVATIGFVNAGLLTLPQSIGIVYGANIGTTTTGWLVALVGLDFKIEALALPMIGLGMLARLAAGERRIGALGEAVAGFGLFFIGIEFLREAFAGFAENVDVAAFQPQGILGLALYVGIGFLMTLLTQSSGASVTLTLSAVAGGVVTLEAGAATVIGTNIGTTSTAVLAALGATANARRVAAAHVLFNVLTGAVALILLPAMLWVVKFGEDVLGLPQGPTAALAGFHTTFNVLGVLIIWPFTARLAQFLENRFVTRTEMLARPQFIDRTIIGAPALALEALGRELERATALARDTVAASWGPGATSIVAAAEQRQILAGLLEAIAPLIATLAESRLSPDQSARLAGALRIVNYLEDVVTLSRGIADQTQRIQAIRRHPVAQQIAEFEAECLDHAMRCDPALPNYDAVSLEEGYQELRAAWHELKSQLLEAAIQRNIPLDPLNPGLEALRSCLKVAEQMTKVAQRLAALREDSHPDVHPGQDSAPAGSQTDSAARPDVPDAHTDGSPDPGDSAGARTDEAGAVSVAPTGAQAARAGDH
jgi:phosphate:Na+ symporter